jgi:hypothetical protein
MGSPRGTSQKDYHIQLMTPHSIIDEIEQSLDEEGLIDPSKLSEIPIYVNGKHARLTNAYDVNDKEFMDWYVAQLDYTAEKPQAISCINRIKFRLLMIACLRYISDVRKTHWRNE